MNLNQLLEITGSAAAYVAIGWGLWTLMRS